MATWSGFAYTAFVVDVFSRRIVGWRTAASMTADLAPDAFEMAIFSRRPQLLRGVIAHSDAGGQYVSVTYTERLADNDIVASVGSKGDSYDCERARRDHQRALQDRVRVRPRRQGPWRNAEHVELATLTYTNGSTTAGCTASSATSHPPSSRPPTTLEPRTEATVPTPTRT